MKGLFEGKYNFTRGFAYLLLITACAGLIFWQAEGTGEARIIEPVSNLRPAQAAELGKIDDLQIFRDFDIWLARFTSREFSAEDDFIRLGNILAAERRRAMSGLIRSRPDLAVDLAVSAEVIQSLPSSISRNLEEHINGTGDFTVLVIDEDFAKGAESGRTEREVNIGNVVYRAFVHGRKQTMTSKYDIPLRGIALDGLMAVAESPVRRLKASEYAVRGVDLERLSSDPVVAESGGKIVYFANERGLKDHENELIEWESKVGPNRFRPGMPQAAAPPWTIGIKRLLFIRVDYPDRPGEPIDRNNEPLTAERAKTLMDTQVSPFYASNSYQKTSIQTVVTPVVRMPQPQSFYSSQNLNFALFDARIAARAAGFDTDEYDLDIVAFSYTPILNFSGIAVVGAKGALLNGSFTFKTVTHELGHEYGLIHANLWRTNDGTITGQGSNVEYGDNYDMMGRGAQPSSHFNAAFKRRLEWLTESNVRTATASGIYRVFSHDSALAISGTHSLKIPRGADKNYYIEYRNAYPSVPNLSNAALMRWDLYDVQGRFQTQMLDMTPATVNINILDEMLLTGESFNDAENGVKITVLGKGNTTPESLDVRVEIVGSRRTPFDFDGDGKSDLSVYRPSEGNWYVLRSQAGFNVTSWGLPTDIVAPGDFDGDGKADFSVFRPSEGSWYIAHSGGTFTSGQFGLSGDIPVPADYDGDGKDDRAVFRPSNSTWYILNSNGLNVREQAFGLAGDRPVPGDYDGDQKADLSVFRPSTGTWYRANSGNGNFFEQQWGLLGDIPVNADFDGDNRQDLAVWRPSAASWYILNSSNGSYNFRSFGLTGDIPVPGDYNGDGSDDIAVFRNGFWYIIRSAQVYTETQFGLAGDSAVPDNRSH